MNSAESLAKKVLRHIRLGIRFDNAYVFILNQKNISTVPIPPVDLKLEEITNPSEEDCDALVEIGFNTPTREHIFKFLQEGQHCYVARYQGKIISCFWSVRSEFYDYRLKRVIHLGENETYCLGAYTLPQYRGKGILDYLYVEVARNHICSPENHYALIFVAQDNHSSLRAVAKMGFEKVGEIGLLNIFGVRLQYILPKNILPQTKQRVVIDV